MKIRRKNSKNLKIDFENILEILKRKNNCKVIGGYYPYNHEVDTIEILDKLEKKNFKISLPKIKKNSQMNFFSWSKDDPLLINKQGIPEPLSKKIIYPDILLVPIVAYDKDFNRIGYGGGFYDRYIKKIKKMKNILTIGLAHSFQKIKKVPTNKNDIKLNYVIVSRKTK